MECHARMTASQTERTFRRGLARERLGLFNGSPRKDKQQTFPLWYSPPSADCLSPRSCLVGRFLIELIYMVIGDFWVPLKEIQSNQSEFGVFFLLGQKRYLGNWLWCNEKAEIPIKWHCDWETWVWVFICRDCEHLSCLFLSWVTEKKKDTELYKYQFTARTLCSGESLSGLPSHFYFIIHSYAENRVHILWFLNVHSKHLVESEVSPRTTPHWHVSPPPLLMCCVWCSALLLSFASSHCFFYTHFYRNKWTHCGV